MAGQGSPYTLDLQASNLGSLTIEHWNVNCGATAARNNKSPAICLRPPTCTRTTAITRSPRPRWTTTAWLTPPAQNPGKLDPAFGGTGTVLNQLDNDYGVYGTESLFYNLSAIDSSGASG